MNKAMLKEMICNAIFEITSITVTASDNLFSTQYNIRARDMIYVVFNLEEKLHMKLTDIFKTNDSNIMTVNNLTNSIFTLMEQY